MEKKVQILAENPLSRERILRSALRKRLSNELNRLRQKSTTGFCQHWNGFHKGQ